MNVWKGDALDRRYRLAVTIAAAMLLGDQLLVQPYLVRLTTDAPLINTSGRQRMLSQQLTKSFLILDRRTDTTHESALNETRNVLKLWGDAQNALSDDEALERSGDDVKAAMKTLRPHFEAVYDAARDLIATLESEPVDVDRRRADLTVILDHEPEYLRLMDALVGLYESEARGRIETVRFVGWVLAGLTLAILVAIGRFVLRPAVDVIRRQIVDLQVARDELEDRVLERTRELEDAGKRHQVLLERFAHVGRTNAIGEMASSLAHELNQPLGAIANYAEGCLIALDAPQPDLEEVRDALQRLRNSTMRAGRIIEQVRDFVAKRPRPHETVDAGRVIADALEILGTEIGRQGVAVRVDLAPDLPRVWGDPVQLQQVLVNLIQNSLQAFLRSHTSNPTLVVATRRCGRDQVELAVSDNGPGIGPDQLERVFDAYFSTRADGMGMGLAICRTIAAVHQGRLTVESEPGQRTTFRFQAPVDHSEHERTDGLHRG
ncbi:ATP-binding protein [Paludisphaera rhizosphaerae]|nr:ATP-binding protein [Paludisphaera rhizosphaerae]